MKDIKQRNATGFVGSKAEHSLCIRVKEIFTPFLDEMSIREDRCLNYLLIRLIIKASDSTTLRHFYPTLEKECSGQLTSFLPSWQQGSQKESLG